jgi:hypothetical protein
LFTPHNSHFTLKGREGEKEGRKDGRKEEWRGAAQIYVKMIDQNFRRHSKAHQGKAEQSRAEFLTLLK